MKLNRDALNALQAVPYLTGIDMAQVENIAREADQRTYPAGQVVFLEGEQNTALYIVQKGWLKAVKIAPDGREQVLNFIGPGEVFNAISIFVAGTNPVTVMTLEPSTLWIIQREAILLALKQYPELAQLVIQHLAEHVRRLITMVEDLSLRTIEARLARYLLEGASEGLLQRQRWATQTEIANRLGTVTDVLNRALRNLASANLIRVERHQIEIIDPEGLAAIAGVEDQ